MGDSNGSVSLALAHEVKDVHGHAVQLAKTGLDYYDGNPEAAEELVEVHHVAADVAVNGDADAGAEKQVQEAKQDVVPQRGQDTLDLVLSVLICGCLLFGGLDKVFNRYRWLVASYPNPTSRRRCLVAGFLRRCASQVHLVALGELPPQADEDCNADKVWNVGEEADGKDVEHQEVWLHPDELHLGKALSSSKEVRY